MQDSIEDYIKITKNIKATTSNESVKISQEVIATVQRKQESEAYAMKIVMFLLDGKLRPEIFLKCLKYINQEYYQDIVEERAISKLCGYPLCSKKIPEMPKQQYFIFTKTNKVYDISERKNYCSNFCYKASLHVKNQIDTSPLWLRNHKELPECKLLSTATSGTPGEEIDQGVPAKVDPVPPNFTSISHFTQLSLEEAAKIEKGSTTIRSNMKNHCMQKPRTLNVINEDETGYSDESRNVYFDLQGSSDEEFKNGQSNKKKIRDNTSPQTSTTQSIKTTEQLTSKSETDKVLSEKEKLEYLIAKLKIKNESKIKLIEPSSLKNPDKISHLKITVAKENANRTAEVSKVVSNNKSNSNEISGKVKISVIEWITLDTFIYIYGEDKIRQVLDENRISEFFDTLKVTELEMPQQLKYMSICRRLHMQELAEEKFDNVILGHSLKPLPDFRRLKGEVQEIDMKVKSFYKGVLYEKPDSNFPMKPVKEKEKPEENEEQSVVMPLLDASSQNALRRKIFLNSINKKLNTLIDELGLDQNIVLSSTHDLVKSFKLQAHNVIFKPDGWLLVAVILLKVMGLKNKDIQNQLEEPTSVEYLHLILSKYTAEENIVEDILILLNDVDKFIQGYITN